MTLSLKNPFRPEEPPAPPATPYDRTLDMGKDLIEKYPEGSAPIVRAEAVNTATTYGYDSVTMMQETKTTLCRVSKA